METSESEIIRGLKKLNYDLMQEMTKFIAHNKEMLTRIAETPSRNGPSI